MSLEKRVEVLEQELEILKNQIQATLLDIRQELLTGKHPSLRSEDLSSADSSMPPTPHVKSVDVESSTPDHEPAEPAPVFRKVVPEQSAPVAPPPRQEEFIQEPPLDARADSNLASASYEEIEDWVYRKLDHMGVPQIRDLIDLYMRQGHFSPEEADGLYQLLSLIEAWNNDQEHLENPRSPLYNALPVRRTPQQAPARSNGHSARPRADYDDPDDDTASRSLVLRLISGVQKSGSSKERRGNRG